MKTFKDIKIGDEIVLVNKYNVEYQIDEIFKIITIEYCHTLSCMRCVLFKDDEKFDIYANDDDLYIIDPVYQKYFLTPKDNFKCLQRAFNQGYLDGQEGIRKGIKNILHI